MIPTCKASMSRSGSPASRSVLVCNRSLPRSVDSSSSKYSMTPSSGWMPRPRGCSALALPRAAPPGSAHSFVWARCHGPNCRTNRRSSWHVRTWQDCRSGRHPWPVPRAYRKACRSSGSTDTSSKCSLNGLSIQQERAQTYANASAERSVGRNSDEARYERSCHADK